MVADSAPPSQLRTKVDVTPPSGSIAPSETPVRPRAKLALLAATIGTWEDDLSHVNVPKEKATSKPAPAFASKSAGRDAYLTESKSSALSNQASLLYASVK